MLKSVLAALMLIAVAGCVTPPPASSVERLRAPTVAHASALAGDDPEQMRETGQVLLALLIAYADWD